MKAGNEAQRSDRIEPAQRSRHSAALRSGLSLTCNEEIDAMIESHEDWSEKDKIIQSVF